MRSFLTFLALFIISTITTLSEDFWEPVNDLFGSSSRDIKFAPDGTAYMATESSGVYRSDDNGNTWSGAYSGIEYTTVEHLAVLDDGELIAGTFLPVSVFYSSDKGNNWIDFALNIKIQSSAPYVFAVNDEFFVCASPDYLHKLSDDRTQWIKVNGIDSYVKTMCSLGTTMFAGSNKGLYKSTDGGYNWVPVTESMFPSYIDADNNIGRLYMSVSGKGLFYSDDNGDNWEKMSSNHPGMFYLNDSGQLFCISNGILTSTDHGKTWDYIHKADGILCTMAINGEHIIVSTKYGPLVSGNKGKNWNLCNYGIRANDVGFLGKTSDGTIFANNENGVYRSIDNSHSWEMVFQDQSSSYEAPMDTNSKGHIYTCLNGYIYVSTNNGDDWIDYKAPTYCHDILLFQDTVFIGNSSKGIMKSHDLENWEEVNDGLPINTNGSPRVDIRTMFEAQNNVILACPCQDGIYRSSNGGEDWIKSDKGIEHVWVMDLAMRLVKYNPTVIQSNGSYRNGDIFAATTSGCGSYGKGIYRSTDNGLTWELKSVGLHTKRFMSIIIGDNGVLYTGAFGVESYGVYHSTDNGETWLLLPSSGLPKKSIISLLEGDDGRLYAGVSGDALYRTGCSLTGIEDDYDFSISEPFEANVFPNPARDMTNLSLNLASPETLTISLYNTKGQLIKTLAAGYYSNEVNIPVDKGELPSGTYYLSIDSGSMLKTIKLNFIE